MKQYVESILKNYSRVYAQYCNNPYESCAALSEIDTADKLRNYTKAMFDIDVKSKPEDETAINIDNGNKLITLLIDDLKVNLDISGKDFYLEIDGLGPVWQHPILKVNLTMNALVKFRFMEPLDTLPSKYLFVKGYDVGFMNDIVLTEDSVTVPDTVKENYTLFINYNKEHVYRLNEPKYRVGHELPDTIRISISRKKVGAFSKNNQQIHSLDIK